MIVSAERKPIHADPGKSTGASPEAAPFAYAGLAAWQREHLDRVVRSNMILLDGAAAWSNELLTFINAQCKQHLERPEAMSKCTTAAEAVALQAGYVHRTTEQYLEQLTRFLNVAARMSRNSRELFEAGAAPAADRSDTQ